MILMNRFVCHAKSVFIYLVLETKPISFLRLSDSSREMEVVWRTGGLPEHYCLSDDIGSKLQPARGYIRDQRMCMLCWEYALCDSISASRVLKGLDTFMTTKNCII